MLAELATIVTPETLLALAPEAHREQVRRQCASQTRSGSDGEEIEALVVRVESRS
jgi:hypothetical protein